MRGSHIFCPFLCVFVLPGESGAFRLKRAIYIVYEHDYGAMAIFWYAGWGRNETNARRKSFLMSWPPNSSWPADCVLLLI